MRKHFERSIGMVALAALLAAAVGSCAGPSSGGIRTYANPLDIGYKYNFEQLNQGISYRSGADPVIVTFHGDYYLFETLAGGWWHSKDLLHWSFVTPDKWPFEGVVVPGAVGYNVRWGIAPDKLHQTYQVFFDRPQPLHVRSLNVGPTYWFAIEAFNESGVSKLSRVVQVP